MLVAALHISDDAGGAPAGIENAVEALARLIESLGGRVEQLCPLVLVASFDDCETALEAGLSVVSTAPFDRGTHPRSFAAVGLGFGEFGRISRGIYGGQLQRAWRLAVAGGAGDVLCTAELMGGLAVPSGVGAFRASAALEEGVGFAVYSISDYRS